MRLDTSRASRVACCWLVRLASILVPGTYRTGWRRQQEEKLTGWWVLSERGQMPARPRAVLAYGLRVFAATFRQRFQLERSQAAIRHRLRAPECPFLLAGATLLTMAVASHWFAGTRAVMGRLPYSEPGRVVLFRTSVPFVGVRVGIRATTVELWKRRSQTVSRFATYLMRGGVARVSPEFFDLLGVRPLSGRTFTVYDRPGCCFVGRDGSTMAGSIGVMPQGFWFRVLGVDRWVPLEPAVSVQAVGRLKPGVTLRQAQEELRNVARSEPPRPRIRYTDGTRVELDAIEDFVRAPAYFCANVLLVSLGLLTLYVALRGRLGGERLGWRYWAFLWSKTALVLGALAAFWMEATSGLNTAGGDLLFTWLFTIASLGAVYGSLLDQRRRCPVCLRRLTLPVSIGSWGNPLLDPVSTELVCEQGHGTLYVPATLSSDREPERWAPLDASWREVFDAPDPKV